MTGSTSPLHTARTRTVGGRERGFSRSSDGCLDVRYSVAGSMGIGSNPEQLFAAAWSISFIVALQQAARLQGVRLPADIVIDAEVDLRLADGGDRRLNVRLNVILPGIERAVGLGVIDAADRLCPYSKATRDNIDVAIELT